MRRPLAAIGLIGMALTASAQGVPVDLIGTYTAARNTTVGATTDGAGFGASGQVVEPLTEATFTPFSDARKPPAALEGVSLKGRSYEFMLDLGDPSTWPNPNSTFEWGAGNAAEGKNGTAFVVRVAGSAGSGPIDLSNDNGLRLAFYRRDGKFWLHLRNLWYMQDVAIPQADDTSSYRVRITHDGFFGFKLEVEALNGAAVGETIEHTLAGGSDDFGGFTSGSFAAMMVNKTSGAVIPPTSVHLYSFRTDAVRNALYAYAFQPYAQLGGNVTFDLGLANLGQLTSAYQAVLQRESNLSLIFASGTFASSTFDTTVSGFPAAGTTRYTLSQFTTGIPTPFDELLAEVNYTANAASTGRLNILEQHNTTKTRLLNDQGGTVIPTRLSSNYVLVDSTLPTINGAAFYQDDAAVTGNLRDIETTFTVNAADAASGLYGVPRFFIDWEDDGVYDVFNQSMGSAGDNTFAGTFNIPAGTTKFKLCVTAVDRSGNAVSTFITKNVNIVTATIRLRLSDVVGRGAFSRAIRLVIGGDGGTGEDRAPLVLDRVVAFDNPGGNGAQIATALVTITTADGLPKPKLGRTLYVYAKDVYSTVGRKVALVTNQAGSQYTQTTVNLTGGDVTNDNLIDGTDLGVLETQFGKMFGRNTTLLGDMLAYIASGTERPDVDLSGFADAADRNRIKARFSTKGDAEPKTWKN